MAIAQRAPAKLIVPPTPWMKGFGAYTASILSQDLRKISHQTLDVVGWALPTLRVEVLRKS
jgi:hypothetical protein